MCGYLCIDVPQVLHTVESLSVDPLARQSLLDHYKDLVLDFLLDFIPTLRIPDVDGGLFDWCITYH